MTVERFRLPRAVLFDLDDTLLSNDMDVFIPAYFELLKGYTRGRYDGELLIAALRASIVRMMSSPGRRNSEVFWEHFAPQLGATTEEIEPFFAKFYEKEFGKLRSCTQPVAGAREVVDWFKTRGVRLVLATNPVYPLSAIEQRLRWAGFEPQEFELLTSYENMHATKPDVFYYREILERIQVPPEQALMVGNDPINDIEPAVDCGLRTFFVVSENAGHPDRGSLAQWHERLSAS